MKLPSATFCRNVFALLAAVGLGGWIASRRVPPEYFSPESVRIIEQDSVEFYKRHGAKSGIEFTTAQLQGIASDAVETERWRNRNHARGPFKAMFFFFGLSFLVAWEIAAEQKGRMQDKIGGVKEGIGSLLNKKN